MLPNRPRQFWLSSSCPTSLCLASPLHRLLYLSTPLQAGITEKNETQKVFTEDVSAKVVIRYRRSMLRCYNQSHAICKLRTQCVTSLSETEVAFSDLIYLQHIMTNRKCDKINKGYKDTRFKTSTTLTLTNMLSIPCV